MSSPKFDSPRAVLDPVAAYDRLAPYYSDFSQLRAAYLHSVEEQINLRIPAGVRSLMDVGAGDGSRALRIAAACGITRVVLLEPSSEMSASALGSEIWRQRAEELDPRVIPQRFNVITCLWNVLGHIPGIEKRRRALSAMAELLAPEGLLFLDVIHRYNTHSYGVLMTAGRWLRDHTTSSENGDVVARWQTTTGEISTYGHVFTDREMQLLARSSGLACVERVVIDYETGELRKSLYSGNLLYVFRLTS